MTHFIETKVRYEKTFGKGRRKTVTELYLVDAESFTEAEARITDEIKGSTPYEFSVSAVRKSNIAEIFRSGRDGDDRFYKVKADFITVDAGREKREALYMLVQASDLPSALKRFEEGMKGTVADYRIAAITETAIFDVFGVTIEE